MADAPAYGWWDFAHDAKDWIVRAGVPLAAALIPMLMDDKTVMDLRHWLLAVCIAAAGAGVAYGNNKVNLKG